MENETSARAGGEGAEPQDPGAGEGGTVNRHRYDVDISRRDRRTRELESRLAERDSGARTLEERLAAVEGELQESRRAAEAARTEAGLTAAGCIDVKAALARLGDFEGDVGRLREACPHLFCVSSSRFEQNGQ